MKMTKLDILSKLVDSASESLPMAVSLITPPGCSLTAKRGPAGGLVLDLRHDNDSVIMAISDGIGYGLSGYATPKMISAASSIVGKLKQTVEVPYE